MVDGESFLHSVEIAEHSDCAALNLGTLFCVRYVSRERTRDMADFLFAVTKRNIDSCPFVSKKKKETEIGRRENLLNALMQLIGV